MVVGACQLPDVQGDVPAAVKQIKRYAAKAKRNGVDVLCFPECYLQGYTRDEGVAKERALDLRGPAFANIIEQLGDVVMPCLLVGVIEIADGQLFNTAIAIRQGSVIGYYRKNHPNETIFKAGVNTPVFLSGRCTFGINICNDANFPETAQAVADQGADCVLYLLNNRLPTEVAVRWRDRHIENLIARAKQTGCWVASSDVVCKDAHSTGYGCTAIVSPKGTVVARLPELTAGMITWDIKKNGSS